MTASLPMASIIVPVFNEERYLPYCLDSLLQQDYPEKCVEIIVVDNGSTDSSVEIAEGKGVTTISSDAEYVGGVRNAGVKASAGQVVVFIDSDCVANKSWVSDGVESLLNSKRSAVGGRYLIRESPSFFEKYWVIGTPGKAKLSNSLIGGCIFVHKSDFLSVGGFSESLTAGEDSLLSKQLTNQRNGYLISPSLSVVHLGYPQDLKSFFDRQFWHSSSFTQDLKTSFSDPMFLLILLHSVLAVAMVALLMRCQFLLALAVAIPFLALPLVLSLKRVKHAKCWGFAFRHAIQIVWVDFVYLCGRSSGVMVSLFRKVFGKKPGKSRK